MMMMMMMIMMSSSSSSSSSSRNSMSGSTSQQKENAVQQRVQLLRLGWNVLLFLVVLLILPSTAQARTFHRPTTTNSFIRGTATTTKATTTEDSEITAASTTYNTVSSFATTTANTGSLSIYARNPFSTRQKQNDIDAESEKMEGSTNVGVDPEEEEEEEDYDEADKDEQDVAEEEEVASAPTEFPTWMPTAAFDDDKALDDNNNNMTAPSTTSAAPTFVPTTTLAPTNVPTSMAPSVHFNENKEEEQKEEEQKVAVVEETELPTTVTTTAPTTVPTAASTAAPTAAPTTTPTVGLTRVPTAALSESPSIAPTLIATLDEIQQLEGVAEHSTESTLDDIAESGVVTTIIDKKNSTLGTNNNNIYYWIDPEISTSVTATVNANATTMFDDADVDDDNIVEEETINNTVAVSELFVEEETDSPTFIETLPPTLSPTTITTMALPTPTTNTPLQSQSRPDSPVVTGQLTLQLQGIDQPFYDNTRSIFLASTQTFFASKTKDRGVNDLRVTVIYQKFVKNNFQKRNLRQLQQDEEDNDGDVLQIDIGVDGLAEEGFRLSVDEWNELLFDLVETYSSEYIAMIQDMAAAEENDAFETLVAARALEPLRGNTVAPTSAADGDLIPPMIIKNGNEAEESDNGEIPLSVIIGAAIGGLVFVIAGVFLIRLGLNYQKQKGVAGRGNHQAINSDAESNTHSINLGPSDDDPVAQTTANGNKKNVDTNSRQMAGETSVSSESFLYTNSAMHHQNYINQVSSQTGRQVDESDGQSQTGGTTTGDMSVMSYAYSLEPGIEPSVVGASNNAIPGTASNLSFAAYPGGASLASVTSGASSFAFMRNFIGKSSTAAGPSNLSGKPAIDIFAPPGKLGIVIDTTIDGPVVHKVNPGSALEGELNSGDIIIAIDGVDTRAMTAAAITGLMVKTANQRRKLSIVRGETS